MTPHVRSRRRAAALAAAVVCVAGAVAAGAAAHQARVSWELANIRPLEVGDCVVVAAPTPEAVHTVRSSCATDPSYTIGALTNTSGDCPSAEYQRFPGPAADGMTAGLCLEPNLVADHCYRLDMPIGVVQRADCTESRTTGPDTGVLVQIRQRLDVHDQGACPSTNGSFAWPSPSPARTYCTTTLY